MAEPLPAVPGDQAPRRPRSLSWSDAHLLGFAAMDALHREFFDVTRDLLESDESSVLAAIAAFEDHARRHFGQEDEWMRSTGFPPRDCHIDEHAAVLHSTLEVRLAIEQGQAGPALVHDFAHHLLDWFPGHADYLDSALSAWMCKRSYGGQPVVLRRDLG